MSECREMREGISAYLDGELSASEGDKVRAHLETCSACRAAAGRMRVLGTAVERIEAVPSGAFRETLFARLEREDLLPRRRSLFFFSWRWLAVPAAAAAAIALIVFSQRPSSGPAVPSAGPSTVATAPAPETGAGGGHRRPAPGPAETPRPSSGEMSARAERTAPGAAQRDHSSAATASLSAEDRDILAYLEILENPQMLEEPSPLEDPGVSTGESPAGRKG